MKMKRGIIQAGVQAPIWFAIGIAQEVFRPHGTAVVTSLTGDVHMPDSLHYKGLAFDLRTRDLPSMDQAQFITDMLKVRLNHLGFDVVLEKDHIHVEYDPKPGENWIIEVE